MQPTTIVVLIALAGLPLGALGRLTYWSAYGRAHGMPRPTFGSAWDSTVHLVAGAVAALLLAQLGG